MVLEKDKKLQVKQVSDPALDGIEEIDASSPSKQIEPVGYYTGASPTGKDPTKIVFHPSSKKKIQLTFENVIIKTMPPTHKCCKKIPNPEKPKIILNNVSGTILPGQFLAIIGASGK